MPQVSRSRLASIALLSITGLLMAACGDSRIRKLDVGMSKDSALSVLAQGAPAGDSLPNMYKHGQYLVDGKIFDVYFFDEENRKVWLNPEVTDAELTPIVMVDGKLAGTGWNYMDEVSDKYRIQARTMAQ